MVNHSYQEVTDQMVAALEQGTVPWHKPWSETGGMPLSMATGRPYRGANIWSLWLKSANNGYASPWWGTYDQIAELSGMVKVPASNRRGYRWESPDGTRRGVREGEKSTEVIFWRRVRSEDPTETDDQGRPAVRMVPLLRTFRVFNADQAEGLPGKFYPGRDGERELPEVLDAPEAVLKGYLDGGPAVQHGPGGAWYRAGLDLINLPEDAAFDSTGERYSTAFHEAGHSTGHESRLNRPGVVDFDHFGSGKYAREELVAEMTAAMLCAVTGVDGVFDNSASYIASWLRKLHDDPKLVVQASANAQRAADLIRGITYDKGEE